MDAEEIILLTVDSVAELVQAHRAIEGPGPENGKRRAPRWPFPGATQLWVTGKGGAEQLIFGTCCNLSAHGLGVRTDQPLPIGATLPIAIHLPQASYHGKATVRHCTEMHQGYFVGMEFHFD
ncbi:MAG: PilZ domain-containing protein [Planctomycetota bacterium]